MSRVISALFLAALLWWLVVETAIQILWEIYGQ